MCQLTLIDVRSAEVFPPILIKYLTVSNALFTNNTDGFGYHQFHRRRIVKTGDDAHLWWRTNLNRFSRMQSYNGIYHVRSSSIKYTNGEHKKPEHAHPFNFQDIIVAHNGTFKEIHHNPQVKEFSKFWQGKDFIDSQKFAYSLAENVEHILEVAAIQKTLQMFTGSFALLLRDWNDKDGMFVVRGETKTLHKMTIRHRGKVVGLIVNTGFAELVFIRELLNDISPLQLSATIDVVDPKSIYRYDFGSYCLVKVGECVELKYTTAPARTYGYDDDGTYWHGVYNYNNPTPSPQEKIIDLCARAHFTVKELVAFAAVVFDGKSLFLLDEEEFKFLENLLKEIFTGEDVAAKAFHWSRIVGAFDDPLEAYNTHQLDFPYVFNDFEKLRQLSTAAEGEKQCSC